MLLNNNSSFNTNTIHSGQTVDQETFARAVPINRTSAFLFKNTQHAADLFSLKEDGNIYTRLGNPTNAVLEERISVLEGGAASVVFSSGTSAVFSAVINIAKCGDEIVSSSNLYGGTYTMFDSILPDFGITTKFVNVNDLDAFEKAITPKTRLLYTEVIGNPALDVSDIKALSLLAHKYKLPLVVDSTFTTPYLFNAIAHGADIVINSLTKWIAGHGTVIGGSVTDSGNFDFKDEKFDLYNRKDSSYHGLRWAHDLPEGSPVFSLRLRTIALRNLGACLAPDNAWQILQGLETLHVRMPLHCSNAMMVANFLKAHKKVAWVRYPGLSSDESYKIAEKQFKKGFGGMVVFGLLKNGETDTSIKAGARFIDALTLFSHVANVGDAKSLAIHPASTSHSQLSEEQQISSGLQPELIRLSIGLEDISDIINDLEAALALV